MSLFFPQIHRGTPDDAVGEADPSMETGSPHLETTRANERLHHAAGDESHTASWSGSRSGERLVHVADDQGPPAEGRPAREEADAVRPREPWRRRLEKDLTARLGMRSSVKPPDNGGLPDPSARPPPAGALLPHLGILDTGTSTSPVPASAASPACLRRPRSLLPVSPSPGGRQAVSCYWMPDAAPAREDGRRRATPQAAGSSRPAASARDEAGWLGYGLIFFPWC
jgi:hypothetical protein